MELELESTEAPVGPFSLDLLVRELGNDRRVIIENQLESTDHDHLGKLLTYASGYNAAIIVWLAQEIREEHRQALDCLNQHTDKDVNFFGVVVEVLQIDDSRPACYFKLVASPNEWQKTKSVALPTERGEAYRLYFQDLIDRLRDQYRFTNARVGQPSSWYHFPSGTSGIHYSHSFPQGGRVRVELEVDLPDPQVKQSHHQRPSRPT